jgi:hypothetical protein
VWRAGTLGGLTLGAPHNRAYNDTINPSLFA